MKEKGKTTFNYRVSGESSWVDEVSCAETGNSGGDLVCAYVVLFLRGEGSSVPRFWRHEA